MPTDKIRKENIIDRFADDFFLGMRVDNDNETRHILLMLIIKIYKDKAVSKDFSNEDLGELIANELSICIQTNFGVNKYSGDYQVYIRRNS